MFDTLYTLLFPGSVAAARVDELARGLESGAAGVAGGVGQSLGGFVRSVGKSIRIALVLGTALAVLLGALLIYLTLTGRLF